MPIGIRTGNPTTTGVTLVALSDLSDPISVSLSPGAGATITLAVCGNDRSTPGPDGLSRIGYIGNVQLTGLRPFTQYTYTADNGTETVTGSFYTAPEQGAKAKFSVAFGTCFRNAATQVPNAFDLLDWYRRTETEYPLIAYIHPDDVCYSDSYGSYNDGAKAEDTGAVAWNYAHLSEYNYSLNYASLYGVLTGYASNEPFEQSYVQNFFKNVNFLPQAGDHEYWNNIWSPAVAALDPATAPNPLHATTGNYDGVARTAWNNFMKPLGGEMFAVANTDSLHWSCILGDLQIISPDCVSNTAGLAGAVTSVLGTDQITEILNKVDNPIPFKVFANPGFAIRDDSAGAYNYKTEAWVETERDRLLLDDGTAGAPKSIMNNAFTNGEYGIFLHLRGDHHGSYGYKFTALATGNKLAESYYEIGLSAVNGGAAGGAIANFSLFEPTPSDVEFVSGLAGAGNNSRTAVIIQVDGESNPPTMTVRRYEFDWVGTISEPSIDKRHVVSEGHGENGDYYVTFEKIFAPNQNSNLGVDGLDELTPFPVAVGSADNADS